MCSATSRLIVDRRITPQHHGARRRAGASAGARRPARRPRRTLGPLTTRRSITRSTTISSAAGRAGLKLVTGGGRPAGLDRGWFIEPTIFDDVHVSSPLWREEIFGPVLCVRSVDSEAEAIALANDSDFGLVGDGRRRRRRPYNPRRRCAGSRTCLGQQPADDLRRDVVGRVQGERHRPRARAVGPVQLSRGQAHHATPLAPSHQDLRGEDNGQDDPKRVRPARRDAPQRAADLFHLRDQLQPDRHRRVGTELSVRQLHRLLRRAAPERVRAAEMPHAEFESIEDINNYLLQHKEVIDTIERRGGGPGRLPDVRREDRGDLPGDRLRGVVPDRPSCATGRQQDRRRCASATRPAWQASRTCSAR